MVSDPRCSAVVRNPFASVLWRNSAFRRVWTASTVSVFGSLVTRIALPLVAILVLGVGSVEMSILRSLDLVAALVFGLVAGAWVDRLRRRPVADLGGPRAGRAPRLDPGRVRAGRAHASRTCWWSPAWRPS